MIEIEEQTRKFSRIYRCPDDIANFKIRIRLFDEEANSEETSTFAWQEKKHSRYEREFYSDPSNCVTEREKKYHEDVKNAVEGDDVIFTYVKEDRYDAEEATNYNEDDSESKPKRDYYDFNASLRAAIEGSAAISPDFEVMHIMADFGEYYDDTWIKSEHALCAIKYDRKRKLMQVFPDYTLEEPYVLKINTDNAKRALYWLENVSPEGTGDVEILDQVALYQRKLKEEKVGGEFKIPAKNKLSIYLFMEILRAKDFETGDIYVQYCVELPQNWSCPNADSLTGVTAASRGREYAHYGFPFEIELEFNIQGMREGHMDAPHVYFEVISKDTWSRFRNEGFAYLKIPMGHPGCHLFDIPCFRILPNDAFGDLRRFFIGDCGNCDPKWAKGGNDVINRFGASTVSAGALELRVNLVHQSHAFISGERSREKFLLDKLGNSGLVKSVEQVLDAFKRARKQMLDARSKI